MTLMASIDREIILAWLLNVYDALITVYATTSLDFDELNPVMRWCLSSGPPTFLLVKIGLMSAVCCYLRTRRSNQSRVWWTTVMVAAALLAICAWNTYAVFWLSV